MPIVRLPSGELRDEIRQPVYDTLTIAATVSPIGERDFFSAVQGKSKIETNLRQNNLLETAVSYRIQGLALDAQNIYALNAGALPLIMENSSFALRVGEKTYWEGNGTYLGGRVDASFAAVTDRVYQKLGIAAVQPVILQGKHVIDINPLQSFNAHWSCAGMSAAEIILATPAADTNLKFLFSLKGLLRRPVQ